MSKFLFDYMKREQMNFCISLIEASFIKNIGKLDYEYESKKYLPRLGHGSITKIYISIH